MARIPASTLATAADRIGQSLAAGLDMRQILRAESERGTASYRATVEQIRHALDAGETFHDAVAATGRFPPLFTELVHVGELTGTLDRTLVMLAGHYRRMLDLRRTFLMGIAWPVFQLVLGVGILTLLLIVLDLIAPGRFDLLGLGLSGGWSAVVFLLFCGMMAAAIGGPIWAAVTGRLGQLPVLMATWVPGLGGLIEMMALSRMATAMALAHDAGMNAPQTVELGFRASQNPVYKSHADDVASDVASGTEFATAFARTRSFPSEFLDIVSTGELSGRLSELLLALATSYEGRIEARLKILSTIAGTAVFLGVAAVFAVVIIQLVRVVYLGPLYDAMRM